MLATPTHLSNLDCVHAPRFPVQVAALRAYHYKAQTQSDKAVMAQYGLDLVEGKVRNNVEAGVLEPALSKLKMIQFATEAAITILRIDDLIKLEAPPEAEH